MAQFARPEWDSDEFSAGWTPSEGVWALVDEVVPDDDDFGEGRLGNLSHFLGFSAVYAPIDKTNHIVRVRAWKSDEAASDTVALQVRWYKGNRSSPGATLLEEFTQNVTTTPTTYEFTLPELDAQTITDYDEGIYIRLQGNLVSGSNHTSKVVRVSWVEIEVPDAAPVDLGVVDGIALDGEAGVSLSDSLGIDDSIALVGTVGGQLAPGRLVDQGRRFRMQRVIVDFGAAAVTINGRGR